MFECFDSFGIVWKDRSNNKMPYLFANIAIKLDDITFVVLSKVEVQTRPSILDNIHIW